MIQLPTKAQLAALRTWRAPNSVTIYSPYIAANSPENNPNRTQLKDLIKEASQLLISKHVSKREVDTILEPAKKLLDSDEFSTNSKHSLALFMHHDFFSHYHLPVEDVNKYVVVGGSFKLQPITKLESYNMTYYVLMISYNGAQLFKGDLYDIKKIKFQKIPKTMLQELNIDEFDKLRGLHTVARVSEGKGSKQYHGEFEKSQINKDMLVQFFRKIDSELHKVIKDEKIPLILAGVDYLLPLYRQVNTYKYLSEKEIIGNVEHTPIDAVREQACEALS